MDKCPNCGGNFPLNDFVCQYCGFVEPEKVKQLSENDVKEISFDDSLQLLQDNLNVLHDINKPSIKNGIIGVMRVILAIHTFGIILIFWKRPKNRFNKKNYENFKKTIQRNIQLLKISSSGSDQLISRIDIIENELNKTDVEIKKNLRAKQITSFLIIAGYMTLFFSNAVFHPILEHPVYPYSKEVLGDLKDDLVTEPGAVKLRYYGGDIIEHFRMYVKLKPTDTFELKDNKDLKVTLQLCDSDGNILPEFNPSELSGIHTNTLLRELKRGSKHSVQVEFEISENKVLNSIPEDLTNFIINTEIIQSK